MTTREDFESQLDARPDDWELRSIYADWLEEQGDPFCETQRWMVANGCTPVIEQDDDSQYAGRWFQYAGRWLLERKGLFDGQSYPASEPPPVNIDSLVANNVFYKLTIDQQWIDAEIWMWRYPTRIAAELDLHNALVKAGEEVWKALEAGHVLVDERDRQEVKLIDGNVMDLSRMAATTSPFIGTENWRIKPKKLPFVEALRALVGHECSKIVNGSTTICVHNVLGKLMPSDFEAEWELVK